MAEINKIQFRRGSDISNAGTPSAGEPIYDTQTKKLYIGDGSTAAGTGISDLQAISDDKLPLTGGTLSGNLNVTADGARLFVNSADYELVSIGRAGSSTSGTPPPIDQGYLRMKSAGTNKIALHTAGDSYIAGGSLGIGTTSPATATNVLLTVGDTSLGYAGMEIRGGTNAESWRLYSSFDGNNDAIFGLFRVADSSYKFQVGESGNATFAGTATINSTTSITGSTITVDPSSGDASLLLQGAAGAQTVRIDQNSIRTTTNTALSIFTNNSGSQGLSISNSGAITFNQAFTFPTSIGSAGQVLKVPSSGTTLEWGAAGGGNSISGDLTVTDYESRITLTKTRNTTQSFHIAHENDDGVLDFLRDTTRTARITNNGRWVIGGHSEVSSSTLSVQGSFGTTGNAIFGGNITTNTNTDYAVLSGIQGGLRVLSSRSSDAGILLTNSSGSFRAQLYGDASGNYGFLDGAWGAWDIKKTVNGDLVIRKSNANYTVYDTQNLPSPITASNIGSQSVSSATSAVRLNAFDNRTISPSEFGNTRVRFGFTSWGNNNSSPYADAFHMSSYGDSSGGSANLVMFKKSGIGMRIWQNSFNNSSAYGSYADVVMTTGDYGMSGKLRIAGAAAATSWHNISVNTGGFLGQYNNSTGIGVYCASNHNELFYYNYGLGVYADGIVTFASLDFKHNNSTSLLKLMQSQVEFGKTILPNADVSFNSGSPSLRWNSTYGNQFYAWDWFRAKGTSGFYFQDYGGGWRMEDSTYIRVYGSKMVYLTNGTLVSGPIRRADHVGGWLEGSYNNIGANSQYSNPIYTIGSNYNPSNSSLSDMYGIGYSHGNFWGSSSGRPTGWGMYAAADGDIRCILDASSGIVWASSSMSVGTNVVHHQGNLGAWADSNRNFRFGAPTNTSGQGLMGQRNDGTFQWQLYGDGSNVGFLDGAFASWDLKKVLNGGLILYGSGGNNTQIGSPDAWGRLQFEGHSNGTYVYANTGSFRVDNAHWNPYDDAELDLGGGQTTQRWRNLYLQSQIIGGFGAMTTGGSSNWNDSTNARSGAGYTLLLGNASNGPSGTGDYFHPHSYEYGSSGGGGNLTQFAIPYIVSAGGGMYMRSRYSGSWSGWIKFHDSNNMSGIARTSNTYGSFNVTDGNNAWAGITYSTHSSKPTIMFKNNHGDGGLYHQTSGSWRWYYAQAHGCIGLNGSTTSSSYGCYITGSVYTTGSYNSSDARFKTNIETIDNGIDKVMNMRGVYYDWNDEHKEEKGEGRQVGVIAQELNKVLPEAVIHTEEDEYSVDYGKITGVLIEAIKDLKNEINELKKGCCNGS